MFIEKYKLTITSSSILDFINCDSFNEINASLINMVAVNSKKNYERFIKNFFNSMSSASNNDNLILNKDNNYRTKCNNINNIDISYRTYTVNGLNRLHFRGEIGFDFVRKNFISLYLKILELLLLCPMQNFLDNCNIVTRDIEHITHLTANQTHVNHRTIVVVKKLMQQIILLSFKLYDNVITPTNFINELNSLMLLNIDVLSDYTLNSSSSESIGSSERNVVDTISKNYYLLSVFDDILLFATDYNTLKKDNSLTANILEMSKLLDYIIKTYEELLEDSDYIVLYSGIKNPNTPITESKLKDIKAEYNTLFEILRKINYNIRFNYGTNMIREDVASDASDTLRKLRTIVSILINNLPYKINTSDIQPKSFDFIPVIDNYNITYNIKNGSKNIKYLNYDSETSKGTLNLNYVVICLKLYLCDIQLLVVGNNAAFKLNKQTSFEIPYCISLSTGSSESSTKSITEKNRSNIEKNRSNIEKIINTKLTFLQKTDVYELLFIKKLSNTVLFDFERLFCDEFDVEGNVHNLLLKHNDSYYFKHEYGDKELKDYFTSDVLKYKSSFTDDDILNIVYNIKDIIQLKLMNTEIEIRDDTSNQQTNEEIIAAETCNIILINNLINKLIILLTDNLNTIENSSYIKYECYKEDLSYSYDIYLNNIVMDLLYYSCLYINLNDKNKSSINIQYNNLFMQFAIMCLLNINYYITKKIVKDITPDLTYKIVDFDSVLTLNKTDSFITFDTNEETRRYITRENFKLLISNNLSDIKAILNDLFTISKDDLLLIDKFKNNKITTSFKSFNLNDLNNYDFYFKSKDLDILDINLDEISYDTFNSAIEISDILKDDTTNPYKIDKINFDFKLNVNYITEDSMRFVYKDDLIFNVVKNNSNIDIGFNTLINAKKRLIDFEKNMIGEEGSKVSNNCILTTLSNICSSSSHTNHVFNLEHFLNIIQSGLKFNTIPENYLTIDTIEQNTNHKITNTYKIDWMFNSTSEIGFDFISNKIKNTTFNYKLTIKNTAVSTIKFEVYGNIESYKDEVDGKYYYNLKNPTIVIELNPSTDITITSSENSYKCTFNKPTVIIIDCDLDKLYIFQSNSMPSTLKTTCSQLAHLLKTITKSNILITIVELNNKYLYCVKQYTDKKLLYRDYTYKYEFKNLMRIEPQNIDMLTTNIYHGIYELALTSDSFKFYNTYTISNNKISFEEQYDNIKLTEILQFTINQNTSPITYYLFKLISDCYKTVDNVLEKTEENKTIYVLSYIEINNNRYTTELINNSNNYILQLNSNNEAKNIFSILNEGRFIILTE